ncbi:MAG TPA: MogA/MoaB family molybdenum cofactor biosynthesis protein [Bryobacteraceae bacterium]|nr:MogA/MoaB family molybdenum cofactor biosynthesis protein [Bryobacteraceae bacterium]
MIQVAVVTVSDSSVAGTREDRSGPALAERVAALGWSLRTVELVPDEQDQIAAKLRQLADSGQVSVILTTGGTGVALRDVTPEATRGVIEREIPGLAELMRAEGRKFTPLSVLSRAVAGVRGRTLIVNLPGSPKGAVQSFDAIAQLVPHLVDLLEGRTSHG